MKIPVCPACGEASTLKLVDMLSGGPGSSMTAAIRCMKVNGGCGEVFGVFNLEALDSSGLAVTFYREDTDPACPVLPRTPKRERARGNGGTL
jgi:hypothetical protein